MHLSPRQPHHSASGYKFCLFSGDSVDINPHQSSRVLPAGCGDHPTHIACGATAWQVPHLCHDPRLHQVWHTLFCTSLKHTSYNEHGTLPEVFSLFV